MKRKGVTDPFGLFIVLFILIGGAFLVLGGDVGISEAGTPIIKMPTFQFPELNLNIINPPPDNQQDSTPPPPPDSNSNDFKVPTSLTIFVNPNPIDAGDWTYGEAVSNGYNSEIVIYAKHKGSGELVTIDGWLGADGKFTHAQPINVAGFWEFWAKADNGAVESNHVILTVQGLQIFPERSHVSMSSGVTTMVVHCYSHMSGNVDVYAIDHGAGVYHPLTSTVITTNGYGNVMVDFVGLLMGDYELELVHENGQTASGWGGTGWVTLGR